MKRAFGAGRKRTKQPFSDFAVEIGAAITARREKLKMSLIDLEQRLDMTHQAISNIEAGLTNPDDKRTRRTLKRIADELKDDFGLAWLKESAKPEPERYVIDITARVAAGDAVEFFLEGEDTDSIEVDPRMIRKRGKYFALRVAGESMEGAHVLNGDIVIVREVAKTYAPSRNDLVVADIDDEGITLKRWKAAGDQVILVSAAKGYREMKRPAWKVKPVAVVVGVVRMLS